MGRSRDLADGSYIADGSVTQADLASGVVGTGPAFMAHSSSAQALSANTTTKLVFSSEAADTANCYDTSTSRFTPNVAGYYQINARFRVTTALANKEIYIYKNGSTEKVGTSVDVYSVGMSVSGLVYLNGTTDYVEIYGRLSNSQNISGDSTQTWFDGHLVRAS